MESLEALARLAELAQGPLNKLQQQHYVQQWLSSTRSFVYESPLLTIDEHDSQPKPFPDRKDMEYFWEACDRNEDTWVIKHRQGMISWGLRASDLRLALSRPNAKIALVFDDKDDGIDHIENRIKPMFECFPDWFRARYKVRDIKGVFAIESCEGSPWRSYIEPIPRGSNKLRSRTYTRICWEEAATQDWMEEAYMGAKPTVQGKKDPKTGKIHKGQIIIVSTPQPETYYLTLGGVAVDAAVAIARGEGRGRDYLLPNGVTTKIELAMPGLAAWKNEFGFTCLAWHWSADPAKDHEWLVRESSKIPGGISSDYWQQEQEMNTHVLRGRATYWAFDYGRNVLRELPFGREKLRTWKVFLSADFGATDPTCWLFWAEDPETKKLIIWDSIYVNNTPVLAIKKMIYSKLRAFAGVSDDEPFNIHDVVRYAVGDPSGKAYMQEYNSQPYPVPVSGNPADGRIQLNKGGENRLNNFFAAQFACCGDLFFVEEGVCPRCQRPSKGQPRLVILESGAPELIDQLPKIRKVVPTSPELEITQKDVKVPDHAVDSAKYGAMTCPVEGAQVQNFQKRDKVELAYRDTRFLAHLEKKRKLAAQASEWLDEEAQEGYEMLERMMDPMYASEEEEI